MSANIPSTNAARISRNLRRSAVIATVAAVLATVASTIVWQKLAHRPTTVGRTMMVVLPFENLTGDQGQDYFCEGMTEELIAQLGNLDPDRLGVIARTTAMHYRGTSKTIKEIAGELGVSYVVEGSIRRENSRIRVTTQLIQAHDQRHLWAHSFDRESFDILSLQRDVSMIIAQELPSYLSISRQFHVQSLRPGNSEAYLDYLKGRFFWNKRNKDGLEKSASYFKKAIAEDPHYARAYAGLADVYLVLGGGYGPPHQLYKLGEAAAVQALALDGDLAEAHTSLGFFKFIDEWDWPGADREFRRAISLDPGYATAHHWYALYLSGMNRMPESIQEIEKALELDPLSAVINSNVGAIYYQSRDYEKSLKQLQKTLELDPNFIPAYGYMAYVYEVTGRYEQALSEYTKAQQITGNVQSYAGVVSRLEALMGRKQGVETLVEHYRSLPEAQPPMSAFTVCLLYSTLNYTDEALTWLKKAVDDREFTATELTHDLRIQNLRADPRFEEIRRQFSIPGQKSHDN